jgi:pimeloyl-ACP methyl ester carboxylesterase
MDNRVIEPAEPEPAAAHVGGTSGLTAAGPEPAGRADPGGQHAREQFGRLRRAAFARRGFAGEGRWIADRAGRESYALVAGDGPRPTVLVHGGVGFTIEWAQIAARLDGPVVIPDRPGFGLSDPHDHDRAGFRADSASWLLELTDGLGAQQIDLVGGSMGGFFAIAFAAAHPSRVRRLILAGAPGGLFRRIGLSLQLWATPGTGALISQIKFRDTETLRKRMFGSYLVHPDRLPADLLEVALAGINLPGTAQANRAILQAVATLRGWRPEMRLDDALTALEVPTLFAWGARDQVAPADVARDLARRMRDAQLTVIEDAGHIPHIDQPDAMAAAINGFLR